MKKFLSALLLVATLVTLVGCSFSDILGMFGEKPSRGTVVNDVYTSEYVGFSFVKPQSWRYFSDEEIAAVLNITADSLDKDKFEKALENNVTIYDMLVSDYATGTTVSVGYENLMKSLSFGITAEEYVEAMKKQLEDVENMNVIFPDELETVMLGKVEFTKCVCTVTMQGVTMTQVYYLRKDGGYMTVVIATISKGYTVDEIEDMFE